MTTWRPRASSLGKYMQCDQIAAYDRGIAEGLVPAHIRDDSTISPYAALGTVEHFQLQDGLRCQFPKQDKKWLASHQKEVKEIADDYFDGDMAKAVYAFTNGDPLAYAPLKKEIAAARTLFNSDEEFNNTVFETARAAAAKMPVLPEGVFWYAEPTVDRGKDYAPGHIDFLASDGSWIVDLKTTSRKPKSAQMKPEAFWQICDYHLNTGAKLGRALYVDSKGGSWTMTMDLDFSNELLQDYLETIPKFVKYLRGKRLYQHAAPRLLNSACSDIFCPYTAVCRDAIIPRAGESVRGPAMPSGDITL